MTSVVSPEAATLMVQKTNQKHNIATAKGSYANWDGVSDGTQFLDNQGNVCIAYNTKSNIVIVKTKMESLSKDDHIEEENLCFWRCYMRF